MKNELQPEFQEFLLGFLMLKPITKEDHLQALDVVIETCNLLFSEMNSLKVKSTLDRDAKLLFEMTLRRSSSLRTLHTNVYEGLKHPIDPMSMWGIVRSQFEAFCNFNNIYIKTNSYDERRLLHELWVVSGLQYRQKSNSEAMNEEQLQKKSREAESIEELKELILTNPFLLDLGSHEIDKMNGFIKKKEFQVAFNNGKFNRVSWAQMWLNAGVNDKFDNLYSMMSNSTHPSNVSVFQFKDLHLEDHADFSANFSIKFSTLILCLFVRDFCTYFEPLKIKFLEVSNFNQSVINGYNRIARDESFKLSDVTLFNDTVAKILDERLKNLRGTTESGH
ncbi:hypothetical protein [Fluviicola taffensis]|uniref:hypothetical protein n=1 Tax=Fluviicola taffensis TaxID=191579 RepID=UPI003137B9CC